MKKKSDDRLFLFRFKRYICESPKKNPKNPKNLLYIVFPSYTKRLAV